MNECWWIMKVNVTEPREQYKISFSSDRRSSLRARWDSSYRIIARPKGCGKSVWRITVSSGRNVPEHMTEHTTTYYRAYCRWNAHTFCRFFRFVVNLSKAKCARPDSFHTKCWVYLFRMNYEAVNTLKFTHKINRCPSFLFFAVFV